MTHPSRLRQALLQGRRRPRNFGAGSPTIFRGDGYEFSELREYVAGDDTRRIDWAATARAGALQTRVVLEDVALTLGAIVDDSQSMRLGRQRSLLDAAQESLHAWYAAASTDDRCARITSAGLVAPPALRGFKSAMVCANAPASKGPLVLQTAFDVARAALPRGAALLVVSDFFDLTTQSDRVLCDLAARFDCTALIAQDPWHDDLPLRGFVRLQDAETGGQRHFFVGPQQRKRYAQAVALRAGQLAARFADAGWRTGPLAEGDGGASLYGAFGLR